MKYRFILAATLFFLMIGQAFAASPCAAATYPDQCGFYDSSSLPPYVRDAIIAKGGSPGAGNVLVLTSGNPGEPTDVISNDMGHQGCGLNPDGWDTFDCTLLDSFVPSQDSVALAISSEWFEWYQTIYTDWMTISAAGTPVVDVSINSWIGNKVDIIPYGPMDTGVVILTSLSSSKSVNFRVSDSGDHIYDTAIVVVPATWFSGISSTDQDKTLLCGNGKLEPGEECDDGNSITDDGCNSLCLGTQPQGSSTTACGQLNYVWPGGAALPYTCGKDACQGYRCRIGDAIDPACFTLEQCNAACSGTCLDIQNAQLDCGALCGTVPPQQNPSMACDNLYYMWPDATTMQYTCGNDGCEGERCIIGSTISPACYAAGECAADCGSGTCVNIQDAQQDCASLCNMGSPDTCAISQQDNQRLAANQKGVCLGNLEFCDNGVWQPDFAVTPSNEDCNNLDDDCNGIVDDRYVTCGVGACAVTVDFCKDGVEIQDPNCYPGIPSAETCNGIDDDCDGIVDDNLGQTTCGSGACEATINNCVGGIPQECAPDSSACDDNDPCTSDSCDAGGACQNAAILKDDHDACTADTCGADGFEFSQISCNDLDPCTIDSCDSETGCSHAADPSCQPADADGDGYGTDQDCDDNDGSVYPGAQELCDGKDNDCDGDADETFGLGTACDSAPNNCGLVSIGKKVCSADKTGTVCDGIKPADALGLGDACQGPANSCGMKIDSVNVCAQDKLSAVCNATTAPADPPGYGSACESAGNSCGTTGSGTIQCDGSCSGVTPQDPIGYGDSCESDKNTCGVFSLGTKQCDGSCNAVVPPTAPEVCDSIDNDCDGSIDNIDDDNDGVEDCHADMCLGTITDRETRVPLLWLGINRWELKNNGISFYWHSSADKKFKPTIDFTHGCSCKQIIDRVSEQTGNNMLGQSLFGCSKGTLEDWN